MRAMEICKSTQRSIARASCSASRYRLRGGRCSGGRSSASGNSTCPRENSSRLYISARVVLSGCEQPAQTRRSDGGLFLVDDAAKPRTSSLCGKKDRWPHHCLFEAAPPAARSEDPNDKGGSIRSPMSAHGIFRSWPPAGFVPAWDADSVAGSPRRAESRYPVSI
jgi:hypothetical protein